MQRAATLYGEAGDWVNAIRVLESVRPCDREHADACLALAEHFELEEQYEQAMGRGWQDRDSSIVLTLQEERAGVEVRLPRK